MVSKYPQLLLGPSPNVCGCGVMTVARSLVLAVALACAALAQQLDYGVTPTAPPPLPLSDPPDAGRRVMQLRSYAADQCRAPVPRVTDAQLVMWTILRDELPYVEQWVRYVRGCGGPCVPRCNWCPATVVPYDVRRTVSRPLVPPLRTLPL